MKSAERRRRPRHDHRAPTTPAGIKLLIGLIYVLGGFLALMSGGEGASVVVPFPLFGIGFFALARGLRPGTDGPGMWRSHCLDCLPSVR